MRKHRKYHKSIKESRMLKEGPGAGYTISFENLNINNVGSFKINNVYVRHSYGSWSVEINVTGSFNGTVDITGAESYYYGIREVFEDTPCEITEVKSELNVFDYYDEEDFGIDEDDEDEVVESKLIDYYENIDAKELLEFINYSMETDSGDFVYGGGYSHSTWDGQFMDVDDNDEFTGYITNQKIIDYVDKAVSGDCDSESYELFDDDNGEPLDEYFASEEEARDRAEELLRSGECYAIRCRVYYDYEMFNGDIDIVDYQTAFTIDADEL